MKIDKSLQKNISKIEKWNEYKQIIIRIDRL
jgi:hypothetical protein